MGSGPMWHLSCRSEDHSSECQNFHTMSSFMQILCRVIFSGLAKGLALMLLAVVVLPKVMNDCAVPFAALALVVTRVLPVAALAKPMVPVPA